MFAAIPHQDALVVIGVRAKVPMLHPKLNIVNNLRMTQTRLKSFLLIDPNDAFMLRGEFLKRTINDQFPQCKKYFTLK
jgi:hypothetical protein